MTTSASSYYIWFLIFWEYIPKTDVFGILEIKPFLGQMRQSNKYGSVRNDEIFNLNLGSGAGPWVSHIYWFHQPKQLSRKNQRTQK